jgi:hypothetical protein
MGSVKALVLVSRDAFRSGGEAGAQLRGDAAVSWVTLAEGPAPTPPARPAPLSWKTGSCFAALVSPELGERLGHRLDLDPPMDDVRREAVLREVLYHGPAGRSQAAPRASAGESVVPGRGSRDPAKCWQPGQAFRQVPGERRAKRAYDCGTFVIVPWTSPNVLKTAWLFPNE